MPAATKHGRRIGSAQPDERKGSPGCAGSVGSGRVLALLAACLLTICAWLLVGSGASTSGVPALTGGPASPISAPEMSTEAAALSVETSQRTSAAESATIAVPAAAPVASTRPKTLVRGSLRDASDAPIQGASSARVSFVDHAGQRRSSDAKQEGAYELHELEYGTYWVTASADGYRSLEEKFELKPNQPRMVKDFTLQKAVQLRIRVTTPEGKDLFEVLKQTAAPLGTRLLVPIATREPPGKRFNEVAGSLNDKLGVGQFQDHGPRADGLPPGCMGLLLLDCDLPVCVSLVYHHVVLQTKLVGKGEDEVGFVLSPAELFASQATIRLCVIDAETRQPIERARVMLSGGSYASAGVATDAQGVAAIDRREPGLFDLQVWAKGYESSRTLIDALPGEITDLGTVALESEVGVEGRVLDLESHPRAASFSLGIIDPVDRVVHWSKQQRFTSSGDGSFAIHGLGRREYVIRTGNHDAVDAGEWEGIRWVSGNLSLDTRAGSITGLELRLRRASKLVLRTAATTVEWMGFRVVDEHGIELVGGRFHGSEPRALALPAGSYRILLLDRQGAVLSERVLELGADTLELELVP